MNARKETTKRMFTILFMVPPEPKRPACSTILAKSNSNGMIFL